MPRYQVDLVSARDCVYLRAPILGVCSLLLASDIKCSLMILQGLTLTNSPGVGGQGQMNTGNTVRDILHCVPSDSCFDRVWSCILA